MPTIKKSKNQNKSKTNSKTKSKLSLQKGGTQAKKFKNLTYKNGSYTINELHCLRCSKDVFKVRTLTMGSRLKELLDLEIFDNRSKVFTCVNCGHIDIFSNNIKCEGKSCD